MVSNRCKLAVKGIKKLGLHFIVVDLGEVDVGKHYKYTRGNLKQVA
jgi:hypothetical protein